MPIHAKIIKPGTRKEVEPIAKQSVNSLKNIHEMVSSNQASAILEKPKRHISNQDMNEINIKKTSRYLEDLTNKGD